MNAERLMMLSGIASFVMTLYWVRNRELREKYALGWTALAVLLLVAGMFPEGVKWFADWAHLSYGVAVLFVALGLIYVFSIMLTVSLTRQYRAHVRLTQDLAIAEQRIQRLERALRERNAG